MIAARTRQPFLVAVAAFALALAAPAGAHPLGNFTINHLTELTFSHGRAGLHYVLDMAEIPTYQAMRAATPDGKMTTEQLGAWARAQAQTLLPQLQLRAGDAPIPLTLDVAAARTRPGAGGLPLIYLTLDAHGAIPASVREINYRDTTFAGRIGWRDVVVAPASEPTHELLAYPNALLGSPRSLTGVAVTLARDGHRVAVVDAPAIEDVPAAGAEAKVTEAANGAASTL